MQPPHPHLEAWSCSRSQGLGICRCPADPVLILCCQGCSVWGHGIASAHMKQLVKHLRARGTNQAAWLIGITVMETETWDVCSKWCLVWPAEHLESVVSHFRQQGLDPSQLCIPAVGDHICMVLRSAAARLLSDSEVQIGDCQLCSPEPSWGHHHQQMHARAQGSLLFFLLPFLYPAARAFRGF